MKKGVIMDVGEGFLTLLTPDGQFLRARKQNRTYSLGEEIHFFPIEDEIIKKKRFFSISAFAKIKPLAASMAALLIFIAVLLPYGNEDEVYAYMSIDVNPSIELGVNKQMKVIELYAYNNEGEKIISSLENWKEKDVSIMAEKILNEMNVQGYFTKNHDVVISTVAIESNDDEAAADLEQHVNEIEELIDKKDISLTILVGTEDERKEAKKLGLTTGKYKEKQAVQEENQEVIIPKENVKKKAVKPAQVRPKVTLPTEVKEPVKRAVEKNGGKKADPNPKGKPAVPAKIKNETVSPNGQAQPKNDRVNVKKEKKFVDGNISQSKKQNADIEKENNKGKDDYKHEERNNKKSLKHEQHDDADDDDKHGDDHEKSHKDEKGKSGH